jgi:alanine transaminase
MSARLSTKNISSSVLQAEYAVRGELVMRAEELAKQLAKDKIAGQKSLSFDEIIYCNIGKISDGSHAQYK